MIQLAAQLVRDAGVPRPHDHLERVASFQGVRWIETAAITEAGQLIPTPRGMLIQVNAGHRKQRRNFSVCHELAHTLIPDFWEGPSACFDQETGAYAPDQQEEFLCDLGASEILMPSEQVAYMLRSHGLEVWLVEAVANRFGASLEAAAIKCATCGVGEVASIVWEPGPVLKFGACGFGFEGVRFKRGSAPLEGSSIFEASWGDGPKRGTVTIETHEGPRQFFAISQGFPAWVDRPRNARRVVSFLFPSH